MNKKILVIVDAQNDFITGALGSDEAKAVLPNICEKIKTFSNGIIITTQDTHDTDYLNTKEGEKLPVEHCIKYTIGWGINTEVAATIVSKVAMDTTTTFDSVEKPTFGSTELIEKIKNYVNDENFDITFVGYCTDICVISNALAVKMNFYDKANVYVDADCCAGVTENKHKAAIEVMKSCQINIENE